MKSLDLIYPEWPAPACVHALSTTRTGGDSAGPWKSFNLGMNCGDEPKAVAQNRQKLRALVPSEPLWMKQVHGRRVMSSRPSDEGPPEADACVSSRPREVLAVLTADCMPVLFSNQRGDRVGIAHAGWRGLAGGVIESTVQAIGEPPENLMAWLGPAIGGAVYEVGAEVRDAFASSSAPVARSIEKVFAPSADRWLLNLVEAAGVILAALGVGQTFGGNLCTYSDPERFFSYRRDGVTGRMASLIWID
jgi:YfiH family protein